MATASVLLSTSPCRPLPILSSSPVLPSPSTLCHTAIAQPQMILDDANDVSVQITKRRELSRTSSEKGQTKLKQGKVTKPAVGRKSSTRAKRGNPSTTETGLVSGHFGHVDGPTGMETVTLAEDLAPVAAMPRRRDWTPPTETSMVPNPLDTTSLVAVTSTPDDFSSPGKHTWKNILAEFGYQREKVPPPDPAREGSLPILAKACKGGSKRRRIELVASKTSADASKSSPAKKVKKTPKKPRTITGQALAPYVIETSPEIAAPLLQYITEQGVNAKDSPEVIERGTVTMKAKKPRTKSAKNRPDEKSTKRRSKKNAPISNLLSPESALKRHDNLDLIFGTSSQLAREGSPTLIRELQQAMHASVVAHNQDLSTDDPLRQSSCTPTTSTTVDSTSRHAARGLWAAASRDLDGSLLEAEVIDLAGSPAGPTPTVTQPPSKTFTPGMIDGAVDRNPVGRSDEGFRPIEDVDELPTAIANDLQADVTGGTQLVQNKCNHGSSLTQPILAQNQSPESPVLPSLSTASTSIRCAQQCVTHDYQPARPDYTGYSTAELTKEVAAYGFKPIKARKQMITLLEKCWESKNRIVLKPLEANATAVAAVKGSAIEEIVAKPKTTRKKRVSKDPPNGTTEMGAATAVDKEHVTAALEVPTKKPRGRPKKNPSKECRAEPVQTGPVTPSRQTKSSRRPLASPGKTVSRTVEEISDSDTPPTPSPPRRSQNASPRSIPMRALPLSTPPRAERTTDDARGETLDITPADEGFDARQKRLFAHITRAVRAQPPSHDLTRPSWQERILMYDPIVLEDLATWLNTQGLRAVGVDEEVGAVECRAWCEGRSVCCLWKANLRGGVRSRY
ncbi:MAG: 5'-flap endonuclease [Caeruleum heppii]|nr:MAG: 5'-flap endonuclease [Caeruleum heppii]